MFSLKIFGEEPAGKNLIAIKDVRSRRARVQSAISLHLE